MNKIIDQNIIDFITEHHVLTLATCFDNKPWCANCFYTYWNEENCFIFTSDTETRHAQNTLKNPNVAASIVLETKTVGKIQGLQIEGTLSLAENEIKKQATLKYLKAFPFAILKQSDLWILRPLQLKLTDNKLGFGKKIIWTHD